MKKIIAISFGLVFSLSALAQEQIQSTLTDKSKEVAKNIVTYAKDKQNETKQAEAKPLVVEAVKVEAKPEAVKVEAKPESVKVEAKPEAVKVEAKPESVKVEAKPIKKKKKTVVKQQPTVITEQNAVLTGATTFHIPKEASFEDMEKFATPISYKDVNLSITKKEDKVFFSLIDLRTNAPLDQYYLKNNTINSLVVKSDFSDAISTDISYDQQPTIEIALNKEKFGSSSCQTIFVQYQLKNKNEPLSLVKFIDDKNSLVDTIPKDCEVKEIDAKDTTFYTESSNIVNIGFNQKETTNKILGMNVHFTKDGREYLPNDLKTYAIAHDFSTFSVLTPKSEGRSPYFGVEFSKPVNPGSYYVMIGYDNDKKIEWIKSTTTIQ
jgi:hypothetical protein